MAQKLGLFSQMFWGEWADRDAINKNAHVLESVETSVSALQATVAQQSQEILRLRAMIMGFIAVVQTKSAFDDAELEVAMKAAWTELKKRPEAPHGATDPDHTLPAAGEPTADEIADAKTLIAVAESYHFAKRFAEARATYEEVVEKYGTTSQAAAAKQQLENLRGA